MNDDEFAELFKQLSSGQSTGSSWQDVRAEVENLGKTLGDVLRAAWQSPEAESSLGRLRELLDSATQDWNTAIDGTPEAQQARDQFLRLTESINSAAERAGEQVRPELLRLLRQANAELRRRSRLDEE
jgi:HAMP domain-containing protein